MPEPDALADDDHDVWFRDTDPKSEGDDIGEFDIEQDLRNEAPNGYGDIRKSHATSHFTHEELSCMREFLVNETEVFYREQASRPFKMTENVAPRGRKPFLDPCDCLDNTGQLFSLTFFLEYVEELVKWEERGSQGDPPQRPRVLLLGVAGTGKSYVLRHMESFAAIFKGVPGASLVVAPTGAAAGGIGASTVDRALKFNRSSKEPKPLDIASLAQLQEQHKSVFLLAGDEVSMNGQILLGNFGFRLDEVLNFGEAAKHDSEVPLLGCVPFFMLMGDFKQLAPVLDPAVYSSKSKTQAGKLGYVLFHQAISTFLVLDSPERQSAQSDLYRALTNLRDATVSDWDLRFWQPRHLAHILDRGSGEDKKTWGLYNPGVVNATCFNKDRDEINKTYIKCAYGVCVVKAKATGSHATAFNSPVAGQSSRIPRLGYFFIGEMVILTVNIVPELGLYNNARGVVMAVLYDDGYSTENREHNHPVVVVDFPSYSGRPWSSKHPTWVPVVSVERRCDNGCCSRSGWPSSYFG